MWFSVVCSVLDLIVLKATQTSIFFFVAYTSFWERGRCIGLAVTSEVPGNIHGKVSEVQSDFSRL